jgi:site-specific recombinase XerD
MRVEDVYVQGCRTWVRLHEKGGKRHEMPCHHKLEADLHSYFEALKAVKKKHGAAVDPKAWLFCTTEGQSGILTGRPMSQPDVYRMIGRRAADAGIATKMSCHTFRATGITEYLRNGGKLEVAQQMANIKKLRRKKIDSYEAANEIWKKSICRSTTAALPGRRPSPRIITDGSRPPANCVRFSAWRPSARSATTG